MTDLQSLIPVIPSAFNLKGKKVGLIVVDVIEGFCKPGAGNLAPPAGDMPEKIRQMIDETTRLIMAQRDSNMPVLLFRDKHSEKPEPPFPPHCIEGSGEENLMPEILQASGRILKADRVFLEKVSIAVSAGQADVPLVSVLEKDCINGWIAAEQSPHGESRYNFIHEWALAFDLDSVIVTGICTDICVHDAVLSMLSARNHGDFGSVENIVVYEPGCATYDMPLEVVKTLGLPVTSAHPSNIAHHIGLYNMSMRGAIIADNIQNH